MKNLRIYKQYQNLPRFKFGSTPTSSNYNGRRLGYDYITGQWNGYNNTDANIGTDTTSTNTNGFSSRPGADLTGDINQLSAANKSNAMNLVSSAGNAAVNGAANIGSYMAANTANNTLNSINFVNPITNQALDLTGSAATSTAGSTAMSTIGNTLGAVGGLAGAAMGGIQFGQGLGSFGNVLTGGVLDKATNWGTEQIGNRTYKVNNGYDEQQADDYGNKQITGAKLQTTLGGLGTGMGVGAAVGSIGALAGAGTGAAAGSVLPGIGTAIGAGIGLLAGGIASIFGGKSAKRKMEEAKRNYATQQNVTNMQEEAVAGNDAAKDNYYGTADKGKSPGQHMNGEYVGKTTTPQGYSYGKVEGLASPDEGMIDMSTGDTQYLGNPTPGTNDPRHDTIPVGGNEFNENVAIPGHLPDITDPYGRSFADQARPYFKANEMIKIAAQQEQAQYRQQTEENQNHKYRNDATKEYMQKRYDQLHQQKTSQLDAVKQETTSSIANLVQKQDMQKKYLQNYSNYNYYNGKEPLRRFVEGTPPDTENEETKNNTGNFYKNNLLPWLQNNGTNLLGGLTSLWALNKEADIIKDKGYINPINVQNQYASKALSELNNLRYNPNAELQSLVNADRQNLYNIRSTSNLSAGQKAALANSSMNNTRGLRHQILMDAANKNAQYRQAYATAMMNAGEAQANRDYNAAALYEQQRIAQNASYVTNQLNHYKNIMTQFGNLAQNISGQKYNNKLLNLYDRDMAIREAEAKKTQTNTSSWTPAGYKSIDDALKSIKNINFNPPLIYDYTDNPRRGINSWENGYGLPWLNKTNNNKK